METNIAKLPPLGTPIKLALFALCLITLGQIDTAQAANGKSGVTISAEVQQQLQKLSPDERKRMEAAIKVGNQYAPHHFDGTAYRVGDNGDKRELKYWLKNIRPLVNRDLSKWYSSLDISQNTAESLMIDGLPEGQSAGVVSVCPQIELVAIIPADAHLSIGWKTYYPVNFADDSFVLKYQAKILGTLDEWIVPPTKFLLSKKDSYIAVFISLDKHNQVNQVFAQYGVTTWSSRMLVDIIQRFISGGVLVQDVAAVDKAKLAQLIQEIKDDEVSMCLNSITNQPSIKE